MVAGRGQGERELQREIELLTRCSHPNLLQLLGYSLDPHAACLVYPLARGGARSCPAVCIRA